MGTQQNCLNEAALMSIQRHAHMIEEYKGTVSTPTKTDYLIAMGTHQNHLNEAALLSISSEYPKIYPYNWRI